MQASETISKLVLQLLFGMPLAMTKTATAAAAASEKQFEVGLADLLAVG